MNLKRRIGGVALCGVLAAAASALAEDATPGDWLSKMARAVQTTNYEGTVIRIKDGTSEALKVVHLVADGVVREKVLIQEGDGLEIIRNGNEVHCILPDKKSVLVEEWNDQSTLFSTLPSSEIRFGSAYDVIFDGEDRVAGRKAIKLAVLPHDEYRFGHRIWLDIKTGFPLQTMLIGDDGKAIEQVKFADITLDKEIHASSLRPTNNIDGFRWYTEPRRSISHATITDWGTVDLPPGFRVTSAHDEKLPGGDEAVTHILLSDGLASVSVFVEPDAGKNIVERSRVGATNSFSILIGDRRVTAVGEVPATTVERIARSMQAK